MKARQDKAKKQAHSLKNYDNPIYTDAYSGIYMETCQPKTNSIALS